MSTFLATLLAALAGAATVSAITAPEPVPPSPTIDYKPCRSIGKPWAGRLVRGTKLPPEGQDYFTWDPVRKRKPNRSWRRYGCDFVIRKVLRVLRSYREAFPDAPRVGIGDLSRPRGGNFDERFGGLGHASHQNGVDVDLYYPRLDELERASSDIDQVDLDLARDLVNRFVRVGVRYAFVGPNTELTGPPRVVKTLVYHDDHVHLRFRVPRRRR